MVVSHAFVLCPLFFDENTSIQSHSWSGVFYVVSPYVCYYRSCLTDSDWWKVMLSMGGIVL
jgi:hypothetical protein